MTRLAEFVLRHRLVVFLFWLGVFVAGGATAGKTTERLTVDFSLPGQQGYETEQQILSIYGNGPDEGTSLIVVRAPAGAATVDQAALDGVFRAVQQQFPALRVLWSGNVAPAAAGNFRSTDGRTAYGAVVSPRNTGFSTVQPYTQIAPLLAEQQRSTGLELSTTGYFQLSEGDSSGEAGGQPSILIETLLGALGALVVLAFVFASMLALLPLLIAAVSILSTFLCVLAVTYVTDISFVVQFLISLVGLGVAIDYSLLVVTRWREEREKGRENHDAVVHAVATAGRAVVASAATVAISLVALVVVPVPFLRSMGIGGMLIPVVSTLVVLTLLPAVLGSIGPRVDWPRIRHERSASRAWTAWAGFVVRRRWAMAILGAAILAALIVPLADVRIGQARTESLARQGPAVEALAVLREGGVPAGVVTPLEVLVRGPEAGAGAQEVVRRVAGLDGVSYAVAPTDPTWQRDGTALVHIVPTQELVDSDRAAVVDRVRSAIAGVPGVVGVAGPGATVLDYIDAVFGNFGLVIGLIALVTFLLLVRTFRSIVLPLKAVLLNIVSVAATFGFVVLFWQKGFGSEQVFNVQSTGAITFWLPVLIFAFLFGLSMDYEVFILARMREEYDGTHSTPRAVIEGLGRTGRLVTCAALILFLAFLALASIPTTDVKVLATALGAGIIIDATVVRALLVPALVSLFGKWNWWLPGWLARLLRVAPSPITAEVPWVPAPRSESRPSARVG